MLESEFGAFLCQMRKKKGFTQKQLAEALFVSDKAVSRWECGIGFPDIKLLLPLSEALDVSIVELLNARQLEEPPADAQTSSDAIKSALSISQHEILSVRYRIWRNILVVFLFAAIFLNLYYGQVIGWLVFGDQVSYEHPYLILYYLRRWIAAAVLASFGLSCYFPQKRFLAPLALWGSVLSTVCTIAAMICWRIVDADGVMRAPDYASFVLFPIAAVLQIVAALRYQTSKAVWIQALVLFSSVCVFFPVLFSMLISGYTTVLDSVLQSLSLASPMLLIAIFLRVPLNNLANKKCHAPQSG